MSTTIIDGSKPRSAKYLWQPYPDFDAMTRGEKDYHIQKWRETEYQTWTDGYYRNGEKILTGAHYFYLQHIKIKSLKYRGLIYPMWRDSDQMIFEAYEHAVKYKHDLLGGKRRGIGWTSIFGGAIPILTCLLYPGTVIPITSADLDRVEGIKSDKLTPALSSMHPLLRPLVYSDTKGSIMFGEKTALKGVLSGLGSEIRLRSTTGSTTVFESKRADYGFLDEICLHPKAPDVYASMSECFSEGLIKLGTMVMGGTAGEQNPVGLKKAMELWRDSETLGIDKLFLPGWLGINSDDIPTYTGQPLSTNGWSNEKAATDWILNRREELLKSKDLTRYKKFVHDYPLTVEEMFSMTQNASLPEEIVQMVSKQHYYVVNAGLPTKRGHIKYAPDGETTVFTPDEENGHFVLLEDPTPEDAKLMHITCGGIDPIPGTSENKDGSDYASLIYHRGKKAPLAYYSERSFDIDTLVRNSILLQKHYYGTKSLLEMNQSGASVKIYEEEACKNLLAFRPISFDLNVAGKARLIGIPATPISLSRSESVMIKYLSKYTENILLEDLLAQLLVYGAENTDLVDAFKWALMLDADWSKKEIQQMENDSAPIQIMTVRTDPSTGMTQRVYINVPFSQGTRGSHLTANL